VILGKQALLFVLLREHEENEHGAEQDRDDSGGIGPLIPDRNAAFVAAEIWPAYRG